MYVHKSIAPKVVACSPGWPANMVIAAYLFNELKVDYHEFPCITADNLPKAGFWCATVQEAILNVL